MMRTEAVLLAIACAHAAVGASPTTPASDPCAIAAPGTCASFACPANSVPKTDVIFCGPHGIECSSHRCCIPVTTVTTTPPLSCVSFSCPDGYSKNAGLTPCTAGECSKSTCCTVIPTTVTTTPPPTCNSFICPHGWDKNHDLTVCATGTCDKTTCCAVTVPPCTTVTTTPATTCESFSCPDGFSKNDEIVCRMGECDKAMCCMGIMTTVTTTPATTCADFTCPNGWKTKGETLVCATGSCDKAMCCAEEPPPCTTVTTTPALTCKSFTCPDGFSTTSGDLVCTNGECKRATCCKVVVTTVTTTPPTQTTPSDPCAPSVVGRKYDAQESFLAQEVAGHKKGSSMMPAWAFPLFGVVTMFSFVAFVTAAVRRNQRVTRQVQIAEVVLDDASFLSDDGPVD